jgi:3-deoxy-D-manno-octulosonic-acid transferase
MEDFLDEQLLLEAVGAGIPVKDGPELSDKMLAMLRTPEMLASKGQAAGRVVAANRGASQRYAALIKDVMQRKGDGSVYF